MYATQTDLEERFSASELSDVADRDRDGIVDAAVVDAALADASELIDGFLAGRYALPLASVPGLVKGWCCDIARKRLHKDSPPEEVAKNYEDAMRQLRDVAVGRLTLQIAGIAPAGAAASDNQVLIHEAERLFTADSLRGF